MSKRSSNNYQGFAFPSTKGLAVLLFIMGISALTGCLGDGTGDPHCDPVPYNKVINPIKIQGNHDVYFNPSDFDFLFKPNIVINNISFQGAVTGKHNDGDADDFTFDVNGTKCSRNDGDRNVKWNCGNASANSTQTRFCSPMQKFALNGGLSILEFMLKVKLQAGALRVSAHAPKDPVLASASIVVTGIEHPLTCPKPPPPPPPPPPVAPKTTITAYDPTASPSNSASKSISFSADQTGVSFSCSLDGAAAAACTSPALYSGLLSGTHTFTVKATNAAGLSDATPPSLTWVVDTQPPSVTITNAASLPALTNQTAITFQFSASEAATFTCQLDGAAAATCTSPFAYQGLSEGTHNVVITAVDDVGNVSTNPASFQWVVDLTPPTTTINQVAPAQAINNSATMTFQFSANETATFACALDNGAYSACQSPFAVSALAEGSHWFTVRATDAAGNQGADVSYSWKTDFTPPTVTIVSSTPPAGNTNAHNLAVDFSASEPATLTCSFDGAQAAACTSPFTTTVNTEGTHTLVINSVDIASNAGQPTTVVWNMDFTAPILSFGQILPSAAYYKNSSSVSLEVLASKPVTMSAALNGTDLGTFTSPLSLTNLAEGSYTVVISAFDDVGNPADSLSYSFLVDLTPPQMTATAAITGLTNLDRNSLTFHANESVTYSCNIDEAGFGPCLAALSLSGLADGVHTVVVHAIDLAGNVSADQTLQWTVDTTPPVTTLTSAQNGPNSFTFTIASNENGSSFQCSLDGQPVQACTSPVTVANISAGAHSFFAQATDPAGNTDSAGATAAFTVSPPTTTLTTTQTSNNSVSFSFASNGAGATFLCTQDGGAAQACTSPLTISGVTAGTHTLLVRAVDAAGNIDPNGASGTWTVLPPTTSITPNRTANAAISFVLSSNTAGATYLCALDGAALAACASPASYSGLSVGTHSVLVRAQDSVGNVDPTGATYSWTVRPPITTSLSSASPAAYSNQTTAKFAFTSNYSDATFVCSINGGTPSACASPASFSGLTDGAKTFTVNAVDPWGASDATGASYSWTVDTVAPTLVSITTSSTSTTVTVNWTTNEASTTKLFWGTGATPSNVVPEDSTYVTSHSVRITGLNANTLYTVKPAGSDRAGNMFTGGTFSIRTTR